MVPLAAMDQNAGHLPKPMRIRSFPTLLRASGLLVWLALCATTVLQAKSDTRLAIWAAGSLLFAVMFWQGTSARGPSPFVLIVQGAAVVEMVAVLCNGYEGFLLVLMAAQLGYWGRVPYPFAWVSVEAVALGVAIALHWSLQPALMLTPPYLGFGVLMLAATRLLREEAETRADLGRANEELRRAHAELNRTARLDERLQIAQNLHDSLGHHLTALSLNLEAASHAPTPESATGPIRTAQQLARASLWEVRALVNEAKEERAIDLAQELQQLAQDLPSPKLHVTCTPPLPELAPDVARVLLQTVQEVTTNSIRHGAAGNLWIAIDSTPNHVALRARDDGRGTSDIRIGFGLAGIQRRIEALGGSVRLGSDPGSGFEVHLELPSGAASP
jgi:signal transduction histidine kinase